MKESKLFENLKQFRDTVYTGIDEIDGLTQGGIDKNEICIISTPTNLFSEHISTYIASVAIKCDRDILQLIQNDNTELVNKMHLSSILREPLKSTAGFTEFNLCDFDFNNNYNKTNIVEINSINMYELIPLIYKHIYVNNLNFDMIIISQFEMKNINDIITLKKLFNIPILICTSTLSNDNIEMLKNMDDIKYIFKFYNQYFKDFNPLIPDINYQTYFNVIKCNDYELRNVKYDVILKTDRMEIRIIDGIQKTKAFAKNLKRVERSDVEKIENKLELSKNNNDDKVKSALDEMRDRFISKQTEIDVTSKPIINYFDIESQFLSDENMKNDDEIDKYLRENRDSNE